MGSNFSEDALKRAARSVTFVNKVSQVYDRQSAVPIPCSHHSTTSSKQDIEKVVTTLLKLNTLKLVPKRKQLLFNVSLHTSQQVLFTGGVKESTKVDSKYLRS